MSQGNQLVIVMMIMMFLISDFHMLRAFGESDSVLGKHSSETRSRRANPIYMKNGSSKNGIAGRISCFVGCVFFYCSKQEVYCVALCANRCFACPPPPGISKPPSLTSVVRPSSRPSDQGASFPPCYDKVKS
ncbi:hypothetical protein Droror1_Dr00004049 [Drosera rotundifolia]